MYPGWTPHLSKHPPQSTLPHRVFPPRADAMPLLVPTRLPLATAAILLGAALTAQSQWIPTPVMWPRSFHAMAVDPVTSTTHVFGGAQANTNFGEVWTFDGSAWAHSTPPPTGTPNQIAYDSIRDRFVAVLAGNLVAEWDRVQWTITPQPNSFSSGRYLLAFDPVRQVTTLVISSFTSTELHDWNGTVWTQRTMTGTPPPWNVNGCLAHDPATGAILSLTAFPPGTPLQVWSCNGTSWQRIVTPVSPPPLEWFSTARDPLSGELLAFAGYESVNGFAVTRNDLWAFDGTNWRLVPTPIAPSTRYAHAMADDPANGRVLMYGGGSFAGGAIWFGDLWAWNGSAWTQLAEAAAPKLGDQEAFTAQAVFDRPRGEILAFPFDPQGTAQTFDGASWTTHACSGTCPTPPMYLGFDEVFELPVVVAANGDFLWSGSGWIPMTSPTPRPTVRQNSALASNGGQLVLFGGLSGASPTNQTWTFDVNGWTQQFPSNVPPPSAGHHMVAMPSRGEVVLVTHNRTWTWDGSDWTDRGSVPFTAIEDYALAYLPERDRVVMHGGRNYSQIGAPKVSSVFEWNGTSWQTATVAGSPVRADHRLVEGPEQQLYLMPDNPLALYRYGSVAMSASEAYGTGCLGTAGLPQLAAKAWQRPRLAETFTVEGAGMPPGIALAILGFRDDQWAGQPLPLSLASVGMPGCAALLEPFDVLGALPVGGRATWNLFVPNDPALLGIDFYLQGLVLDAPANVFGATVTNGLRNRVGKR